MSTTYSIKRLVRDLKEIKETPKCEGLYIHPVNDDMLEWHGNLVPKEGRYKGIILHYILKFPETYPLEPPKITLGSGIPHSNIIPYEDDPHYLCMDMIKNFFWMNGGEDKGKPYTGWSTAYNVMKCMVNHKEMK
jgi:ubiquitin-protein ligase